MQEHWHKGTFIDLQPRWQRLKEEVTLMGLYRVLG